MELMYDEDVIEFASTPDNESIKKDFTFEEVVKCTNALITPETCICACLSHPSSTMMHIDEETNVDTMAMELDSFLYS